MQGKMSQTPSWTFFDELAIAFPPGVVAWPVFSNVQVYKHHTHAYAMAEMLREVVLPPVNPPDRKSVV